MKKRGQGKRIDKGRMVKEVGILPMPDPAILPYFFKRRRR